MVGGKGNAMRKGKSQRQLMQARMRLEKRKLLKRTCRRKKLLKKHIICRLKKAGWPGKLCSAMLVQGGAEKMLEGMWSWSQTRRMH